MHLSLLIALAGCDDTLPDTHGTDDPATADIVETDSTEAETVTDVPGPVDYWPADADHRVCGDGSGDFLEIQEAIDASTPLGGEKIAVCPGTYGPIYAGWQVDVVVESVEGRDVTTIDGGSEPAVIIHSATVVLDGFRITGTGIRDPWYPEAGAISVHESDVTLRDLEVDGATGSFALLFDENHLVMEDTLWKDNTGSDMLWFMYQGAELTLRDNTVLGGTYEHVFLTGRLGDLVMENNVFAGIVIATAKTAFDFDSTEPGERVVQDNLFYDIDDLDVWGGRLLDGDAVLRNNIVLQCDTRNLRTIDSSYSLYWDNGVDYAPFVTGPGNLFVDPLLTDPANGDYTLQAGSPAIDAGDPDPAFDDADGSRNDMGPSGGM